MHETQTHCEVKVKKFHFHFWSMITCESHIKTMFAMQSVHASHNLWETKSLVEECEERRWWCSVTEHKRNISRKTGSRRRLWIDKLLVSHSKQMDFYLLKKRWMGEGVSTVMSIARSFAKPFYFCFVFVGKISNVGTTPCVVSSCGA